MTPEAQLEIVKVLGDLAERSYHEVNDAGDVVRFAASNDGRYRAPGAAPKPGIDPANFPKLLQLEALSGLFLEAQPLDDASYRRVVELRNLLDLRIHRPLAEAGATAGLAGLLAELSPIETLELAKADDLPGAVPADMEAQPHIERAVCEGAFASPVMIAFLAQSPIIQHLRLTGTTVSNEQFARLVESLESLRTLMLGPKPGGSLDGRALAALRGHPTLAAFFFRGAWRDLAWEGQLEVLTEVPEIEFVDFGDLATVTSPESDLVKRFQAARPDVTLRVGGEVLPGDNGERVWTPDEDAHWGLAG